MSITFALFAKNTGRTRKIYFGCILLTHIESISSSNSTSEPNKNTHIFITALFTNVHSHKKSIKINNKKYYKKLIKKISN